MTAWIVVFVGGLVTYLMRGSFLFVGDRVRLPGWVESALGYVAPAAFAAIALPATLGDDGFGSFVAPTPTVVGVAAGVVAVARWRNIPAGLATGIVLYALTSAL